jgi:hypothetical protein
MGVDPQAEKLPDCIMAPWKSDSPLTVVNSSGIARIPAIEQPPDDCPKIVTLFGSPPNAEMLVRTHFRDSITSRCP